MSGFKENYLKKTDHCEIKSIIRLYGLVQLITKPTRTTEQSNTLIDIICSTNPSTICKTDVIPLSIGDHDMVGLVRKLNHLKYAPRTIKCRNYTQYHPEKMCGDLKGHNWEQLYLISDVNNAWNFIKDILSNTFNKHAPMINKRVKGNFCPWLTSHIKALMNERDKKLRKAQKTKKEVDWSTYRNLRNECTRKMRLARSNYNRNLLGENVNQPRKFWKVIKNKPDLSIPVENKVKTSNESKANEFCSFFF